MVEINTASPVMQSSDVEEQPSHADAPLERTNLSVRNCFSEGDADSESELSRSDGEFVRSSRTQRRLRRVRLTRKGKTQKSDSANNSYDEGDDSDYEMDRSEDAENCPLELDEVYNELFRAASEMKFNVKSLREREESLKLREQALLNRICEFEQIVMSQSNGAEEENDPNELVFAAVNEPAELRGKVDEETTESEKLREALAKKTSEARRLARDFSTLKSANEALKSELQSTRQRCGTLEQDCSRLSRRVVNLKRLNQQLTMRNNELRVTSAEGKDTKNSTPRSITGSKVKKLAPTLACNVEREVLFSAMRCLTDLHARSVSISIDSAAQAIFVDHAIAVTSHFVDLLRAFDSSVTDESECSFLTFVFICVVAVRKQLDELEERANERDRATATINEPSRGDGAKWRVAATLRRIGEEIWKLSGAINDEKEKQKQKQTISEAGSGSGNNDNEVNPNEPNSNSLQSPRSVSSRRLLNSANLQTRVLSQLTVLVTLSGAQNNDVDRLVRTLNRIRNELLSNEDAVFNFYAADEATQALIDTLRRTFASSANRLVLAYTLDALVHVAVRGPRSVADRLVTSLAEPATASKFLDTCVTYLRGKLPITVAPKRSGEIAVTSDAHSDSMRIDDFDWKILEKLAIVMQKLSAIRTLRAQFVELGVSNYVRVLLDRCEQAARRQTQSASASSRTFRNGSAMSLTSGSSTIVSPSTPRTCSHLVANEIDYEFLTLNLKSIVQNLTPSD